MKVSKMTFQEYLDKHGESILYHTRKYVQAQEEYYEFIKSGAYMGLKSRKILMEELGEEIGTQYKSIENCVRDLIADYFIELARMELKEG